jgi:hypothetical protein
VTKPRQFACCHRTIISVLFSIGRLRLKIARMDHLDVLEAESIYILREVAVEFSRPAMLYSKNRTTGSFILIDPEDDNTIAAGLIVECIPQPFVSDAASSPAVMTQHRGVTVWLTGLSGPGKSTIAEAVCTELLARGMRAQVLDADLLRKHLTAISAFRKKIGTKTCGGLDS